MSIRKVIQKQIRHDQEGLSVAADVNAVLAANVGGNTTQDRPDEGGHTMGDEFRKLSREELDAIAGEALPDRAAMSLINANVAAPVNVAAALNVLSDHSTAYANAEQTADIKQST